MTASASVYEELERVQRKCFQLKQEVERLRHASSADENASLRAEAQRYKRALTRILYRLDHQGQVGPQALRNITEGALGLTGLKPWRRDRIRELHGKEGE